MKKIVSILAIAFVSLSFVSCRQDDAISEMESDTAVQTMTNRNKIADTVTADSIKTTPSAQAVADPPKDPPKDRTDW